MKELILGLVGLAIIAGVSYLAVRSFDTDNGNETVAISAEVKAPLVLPTPIPLVRVTIDHANGFVCYDNMASIACQPLWYGVPPPEAIGYVQSTIGRVFATPPTPRPAPTPLLDGLLDGIN